MVPAIGGSINLKLLADARNATEFDDAEPTEVLDLSLLVRRAMEQVESSVEVKTWRAFWRSVVDSIPTAVVVAELQISPHSVRQARSRILRRIREQLGDC